MAYFYRAGNLEGGLVEETAQIGIFASKSPDIDQDANMTPEFFQHLVFGLLARKFFHRLLTLHPRVRAKNVTGGSSCRCLPECRLHRVRVADFV